MIVSDGGSRDATREIAARAGATVIHAAGGRAAQQNLGAVIAKGRILLFFHADAILPDGYALAAAGHSAHDRNQPAHGRWIYRRRPDTLTGPSLSGRQKRQEQFMNTVTSNSDGTGEPMVAWIIPIEYRRHMQFET
jgi:glycosyltransferase involved in cell wall biosynthesis